MSHVDQFLNGLGNVSIGDAAYLAYQTIGGKMVSGSHSSIALLVDTAAILFSPPTDLNKLAIVSLQNESLPIPVMRHVASQPLYNVFIAPKYRFLTDLNHSHYVALVRAEQKLPNGHRFDARYVYSSLRNSRNEFVKGCSTLLKRIIKLMDEHKQCEFYFDVQPSNVAIGHQGELLAYDIFNVERKVVDG